MNTFFTNPAADDVGIATFFDLNFRSNANMRFSEEICARRALNLYGKARRESKAIHEQETAWNEFTNYISMEWNLLANLGAAAGEAMAESESEVSAKKS